MVNERRKRKKKKKKISTKRKGKPHAIAYRESPKPEKKMWFEKEKRKKLMKIWVGQTHIASQINTKFAHFFFFLNFSSIYCVHKNHFKFSLCGTSSTHLPLWFFASIDSSNVWQYIEYANCADIDICQTNFVSHRHSLAFCAIQFHRHRASHKGHTLGIGTPNWRTRKTNNFLVFTVPMGLDRRFTACGYRVNSTKEMK